MFSKASTRWPRHRPERRIADCVSSLTVSLVFLLQPRRTQIVDLGFAGMNRSEKTSLTHRMSLNVFAEYHSIYHNNVRVRERLWDSHTMTPIDTGQKRPNMSNWFCISPWTANTAVITKPCNSNLSILYFHPPFGNASSLLHCVNIFIRNRPLEMLQNDIKCWYRNVVSLSY